MAATEFKILGVGYDKNRNNKKCFRDGTPPKIMALAANPNDRTDPLWYTAVLYLVGPECVYESKKVDIVKPG